MFDFFRSTLEFLKFYLKAVVLQSKIELLLLCPFPNVLLVASQCWKFLSNGQFQISRRKAFEHTYGYGFSRNDTLQFHIKIIIIIFFNFDRTVVNMTQTSLIMNNPVIFVLYWSLSQNFREWFSCNSSPGNPYPHSSCCRKGPYLLFPFT